MKIRSGFVSNSSSSSFVVLGTRIPENKFKEMGGYEFFEDKVSYVDLPEGDDRAILGVRIGRWSEGEDGISTLDLEDFEKKKSETVEALGNLFPDERVNIQLIFGSTYG